MTGFAYPLISGSRNDLAPIPRQLSELPAIYSSDSCMKSLPACAGLCFSIAVFSADALFIFANVAIIAGTPAASSVASFDNALYAVDMSTLPE